jgi:hypothetical protein
MASSSGWTLISTDLPPAWPSCGRVDHHRGLAALERPGARSGWRPPVRPRWPDLRVIWSHDPGCRQNRPAVPPLSRVRSGAPQLGSPGPIHGFILASKRGWASTSSCWQPRSITRMSRDRAVVGAGPVTSSDGTRPPGGWIARQSSSLVKRPDVFGLIPRLIS